VIAERKNRRDSLNGRKLPIADSAATLHPTALKIVQAAKRLMVAKGFEAITLEAIAAEAGVNKASTRYYFGSKAGLMGAVVDEIVLDGCATIGRDASVQVKQEECIESFIANVHRMATDGSSYAGYFDLLPHAVRDRHLRSRLAYLYDFWYEWNIEWLGLDDLSPELDDELRALGQFTASVADGIAIQAEIHGKDYDPAPALCLLREFLTVVRARMLSSVSSTTRNR
jgi:AcrR family transcriptional regulator